MHGNPYVSMLSLMREQGADSSAAGESAQAGLGAAPCRMRLGRVVSTVPLVVSVSGLKQPTRAVRINERLTKGAKWKTKTTSPDSQITGLTGPISGPVPHPPGAGQLSQFTGGDVHIDRTVMDEATVEQLELDLEKGDLVLLLTEDDQRFYLVMKVVDAV